MGRRTWVRALLAAVAFSTVPQLAPAAPKAKLVAEPAKLELGEVTAGEQKTVGFTLKNEGDAEAKGVTCKAKGFAFDRRKLVIAAGASEEVKATYTAAKKPGKKDAALKIAITCGAAKLTATGTLKAAAGAAAPAPAEGAKPAEAKAKAPPAKLTLAECRAKQAPVAFDHKAHYTTHKVACDTCHHTQKGLTLATATGVKKCATCHLNPTGKAPSCQEMALTKNPFHIRCVGCHKQKGAAAPTTCTACHKK
ncbi:MAG TPA: cytochrome c3 family protein [Polyangia bacterium]